MISKKSLSPPRANVAKTAAAATQVEGVEARQERVFDSFQTTTRAKPQNTTRATTRAKIPVKIKTKTVNLLERMPYWEVFNGVVFLEDGKMELGFEITFPSRLFQTVAAKVQMHRSIKSLLQLGLERKQRGRIYIEVQPSPAEDLHPYRDLPASPHPIANLLSSDRYHYLEGKRQQGEVKRWRFYYTLSVQNPCKFSKDEPPSETELLEALSKAKAMRGRVLGYLGNIGIKAKVMDDQAITELLCKYANPQRASKKQPRYIPPHARGTGQIDGKEDAFTWKRQIFQTPINNEDQSHLRIGEKHVAAIGISKEPSRTMTGMVNTLLESLNKGSYYVVIEFDHVDPSDTDRELEGAKNKLFAQVGGGKGEAKNVKAAAKLEQIEETIKHITQSGDHMYKTGLTVITIADSKQQLEENKNELLSACDRVGAKTVAHSFQSHFQWFALMPFNGQRTPFPFEVTSSNAADYFPTLAPWKGAARPTWLVRTRHNSLASIDFFLGGTAANHFAVFAPTGYGKTFTVLSFLIAHIRAYDPFVTIVDKKNDFKFLIESLNGVTIPFYPGSTTQLNPLDLPRGELEPDEVKLSFLLALIRMFVPPSSSAREAGEEKALILEAITQTYRQFSRSSHPPLLSDLRATLQTMEAYGDGKPILQEQTELARSVALRLRPYTGDSSWGRILDRPSNVEMDNQFVYYDLSGIGESEQEMRRVALHLIQDRIWQSVKVLPRERRKLTFIDEFGSQIQTAEDKAFVSTTLRVGRSYNLAFGFATQTLEDMKRIEGLEEAIYYYLLGRLEGGEAVIKDILKLPDSVAQEIGQLQKTADYTEWALVYRSSEGAKEGDIIKVEESKRAYWYLTSEPLESGKRAKALERTGGDLKAAVELLLQDQKNQERKNQEVKA
jgi:hypothetical protein